MGTVEMGCVSMTDNAGQSGAIVQAAGIGYAYEHHRVLSDVSLTISPGERLTLLGANGSGKSTLLRTLAGSLKPDSGEVRLDGAPYNYSRKGRNDLRRAVQMVTQDPDEQIFAASVFADVSFGPVNMGLSREEVEERVRESLATAEISDLAERVPHQLSYGQRKRVALAGALAMRPRVLLLDEPSAGLDPQATRKLAHTLNLLREQGTAVVVATHDIDFAWNFAERAAVLADGTLRVGSKEEILADKELIKHARLALPWAPLVSAIVGREVQYPEDCADLA
jgi:cobalt/nickel transport system ATP-binding protein